MMPKLQRMKNHLYKKTQLEKKTQIGKQTIVLRFFSLFLTPCVLIPAARIVTRGYAPLGVTAACVFPAPFRAQYLLEYCFSWMRSWVRAFRFLNESFAESKKNIVIALLLISWNDETWVSANICENQTCIGVGFLQNKKHTHAHTTSWSGHNLFYRKKNPTYTNNENLISSYRISFCKPPSFS